MNIKKLCVTFIIATLVVFGCEKNELQTREQAEPEVIQVYSSDYFLFTKVYGDFVKELTETQKLIIMDHIATLEEESSTSRVKGVSCSCPDGHASCTASGQFGECCICWDPTSQNGACGVLFGIPECKVGAKEPPRLGRANSEEQLVTFYPAKFRKLLDELEAKNIATKNLDLAFEKMKLSKLN